MFIFKPAAFVLSLLGLFVLVGAQAQPYLSVKDFGATGKKDQLATAMIQQTIDRAAGQGGGTVYFPAGDYTTATIQLKPNVRLFLEAGATVFASNNPNDYNFTRGNFGIETNVPVLLYALNADNIAIEGRGTIDGQARHRWSDLEEVDGFIKEETENARRSGIEMKRAYALDPKVCLIYLMNCNDVLVRDVKLLHSPNWTLHIAHSQRVNVDGIYLFSSLDRGVNADGIDIDGCKDVRIANCTVITGDDAICMKTTNQNGKVESCENVTITNCTLVSTSTALKLGTESHGDFRNIVMTNCTIRNTNRGIGIFVRDGAVVDNVIFSNLVIECNRKHFNWWGDGDPIRFVLLKRKPESKLGQIKNVLVQNVIARGQGTSLIQGHSDRDIENLTIDNLQLVMENESLADKRATHGLRIDRVKGARVSNAVIRFEGKEAKWQHALALTRSSQIDLDRLLLDGAGTSEGLLLDEINGGHITNVRTSQAPARLVKLGRVTGVTAPFTTKAKAAK